MSCEYSIVKGNKLIVYRLRELEYENEQAGLIVLTYDYKNKIHPFLTSLGFDGIGFEDYYRFAITGESIKDFQVPDTIAEPVKIKARVSKEEYLRTVTKLKQHIQRGDIYEINYCMEFYAENCVINPEQVFCKLYNNTQAPHACFLKINDCYLICGSPERFLKKDGDRLISQPIKGTRRRGANAIEDKLLVEELRHDAKERSENIMITDLVRNDLSQIAQKGTVNVDELCEVYTFKSVHQMISTVSCMIKKTASFRDIINATFPMGSMTGAPKIRAMELIEKYESAKRGLYSGSVGLINANGDFDLNVVIRSILYNAKNKYLSIQVGSAITIDAQPEKEYEECLLKLQAMLKAVNATIDYD